MKTFWLSGKTKCSYIIWHTVSSPPFPSPEGGVYCSFLLLFCLLRFSPFFFSPSRSRHARLLLDTQPIFHAYIIMADRRIWRDSDWLRAGKTYPAEPQKFICNARDAITAIPSNYKKLLPAPDLSVHNILRLALPPLSDALVLEDPATL
jgi:hypothetical protein